MTNRHLTSEILAKETLAHLENSLMLAGKVHTDYSKEFNLVGDVVNVTRPPHFVGQKDNIDVTNYNEDIQEAKFPVRLDRTITVKFSIKTTDMTLKVSDEKIQEHYIQPAVISLGEAGGI